MPADEHMYLPTVRIITLGMEINLDQHNSFHIAVFSTNSPNKQFTHHSHNRNQKDRKRSQQVIMEEFIVKKEKAYHPSFFVEVIRGHTREKILKSKASDPVRITFFKVGQHQVK